MYFGEYNTQLPNYTIFVYVMKRIGRDSWVNTWRYSGIIYLLYKELYMHSRQTLSFLDNPAKSLQLYLR